MRFPKRSEYALRALVMLSRCPRDQFLQIQEVSNKEDIPVKFLEQILLTLRNAGILNSKRGIYGGYALARSAEEILVGEVMRAMDGPIETIVSEDSGHTKQSSVSLFLQNIDKELNDMLDKYSIADIARIRPESEFLEFQI